MRLDQPVDVVLGDLLPKFYMVYARDLEKAKENRYPGDIRPIRVSGNKNVVVANVDQVLSDRMVVMKFVLDDGQQCSVFAMPYKHGENRWITADRRLVFVPENDPSFLYDQETKKWLGEDIDELIPSMRAIEALKTGGIETVGQLVQLSARDLMKLPSFGRKCLKHTVEALAEQGLSLAPDDHR
jgi:hypothetical protein